VQITSKRNKKKQTERAGLVVYGDLKEQEGQKEDRKEETTTTRHKWEWTKYNQHRKENSKWKGEMHQQQQ